MVRQLMKLIVGEEVLKESSPTGKNGWKPIPDDVYEAVERFVNENAVKKKYTLSSRKYREVLTAMCVTLRNPKPKKTIPTDGKSKNLSKNFEHIEEINETDKAEKEFNEINHERSIKREKKPEEKGTKKHESKKRKMVEIDEKEKKMKN